MTGKVETISRTYRKIKGKYYARIRHQIDDGKPLDILRQVENKSAIKLKQAKIEIELLQHGPAQLVAGKVTILTACSICQRQHLCSCCLLESGYKNKRCSKRRASTRRPQQSGRLLRRHRYQKDQ